MGEGRAAGFTRAVLAAALALGGGSSNAAEPSGFALAAPCLTCHSAIDGAIPTLAGLDAQTIAARMRAYRSGEQPSTVMQRLARGYSDAEIELIGAWLETRRERMR